MAATQFAEYLGVPLTPLIALQKHRYLSADTAIDTAIFVTPYRLVAPHEEGMAHLLQAYKMSSEMFVTYALCAHENSAAHARQTRLTQGAQK